MACVYHLNHMGVELSRSSLEILSNESSNSFLKVFFSINRAGRFRSPKSTEEENSLVSETTPKATQCNTGLEKSLRNGNRDGKMNVKYKNILYWPVSNTKMFQVWPFHKSTCSQIC